MTKIRRDNEQRIVPLKVRRQDLPVLLFLLLIDSTDHDRHDLDIIDAPVKSGSKWKRGGRDGTAYPSKTLYT